MPTKADLEAEITELKRQVLLKELTTFDPYEEVEGDAHWLETQESDYDRVYTAQ